MVETVSIIGSTQNGSTSYPVKIVIEEYEGLIPGMNVNTEIILEEAENALVVPICV